ncbi:hypothetical protein [Methylobacterium sp. JK268]
MHAFSVAFLKTVSDDTGHERSVLQWRCVVQAPSAAQAVADAKARLCDCLGVADWRVRADRCEIRAVAERAA